MILLSYVKSERGVAALIALIMVGLLTILGLAALSTTDDEISIAGNELQELRAFYAAEAGLEKAASMIQDSYEQTGHPPDVMPSDETNVNTCAVSFVSIDNGAAEQRPLSQGTLAGLHALVKSFDLTASATSGFDNSRVELSETFETALIPIFQFAVFYGNNLEIAPGPDMTLIGRVHSNGNLYLQSGDGSTLTIDSYVTASGSIMHGRHPDAPMSTDDGQVRIKDAAGDYQEMYQDGTWLDAGDTAVWFDSSLARWGGRVQDSAHGQGELNLPLTDTDDPHAILERADGNPDSYEDQADIKVVNDTVLQRQLDGTWADVTSDFVDQGIISTTTFYDAREGENVTSYDLNVGAMFDSGYAPANGILYFSQLSMASYPALRLQNGSTLDAPFTVVSENPVYTQGNYNSDPSNKQPAAILGDAVTFLSGAWNDGDSWGSKYDRYASETTVNASILTGNVETTSSAYSGGFENLPRFLEVWSGTDFNWMGSMVNLWEAVQADGSWDGSYYSPPNRNWSYDPDLDDPTKLPPATPVVRVFQRTGWKQEYVGYNLDG